MHIDRLDHLVLTVTDLGATLHQAGQEFAPKAASPTPGSADLCLITELPLDLAMAELRTHGVEIEEGPVERTGAMGPITSVYIRDPDRNLIEISTYGQPDLRVCGTATRAIADLPGVE